MSAVIAVTSKYTVRVKDLLEITRKSFQEFKKLPSGDVTQWLDLLRTCRQPQILWEVDYLESREGMDEVEDYVRQTASILYEGNSVIMRPQFTAHLDQQVAFNTIRAHVLAQTDVEAAQQIFSDMLDLLYTDLSVIRKSNLLYHACLSFLCCNNFEDSYDCFERHWGLLKYASPSDRVKEGIIDNYVILQMVYWLFIKHVENFRDFYSVRTKTDMESIWNHKKISLLYFLEYDSAWAASACGYAFYKQARINFPSLPKYERKRSTPTNVCRIWHPDDMLVYDDETEAVGEEKYYFEQFNLEIDLTRKFPNPDKADDYLYSYYHYQNNYVKDFNDKILLVDFIRNFVDIDAPDPINKIIELGCGIEMPAGLAAKDYLGIDISSKVCSILEEQKNMRFCHAPADKFMMETEDTFDLCFACDLLSHLKPQRLNILLKSCSEKCKFLAATIDTRDDFRSDILSKKQRINSINMHRTVRTHEEWINMLEKYFQVDYQKKEAWLYVFCRSYNI